MNTLLYMDSCERYERHRKEFQALNPQIDFKLNDRNNDYADKTIYPIESKWREEQDVLMIAERASIVLVLGDIVEFRHSWNSPGCNTISKRTLGIVTEDWAILGPKNQNSVGLDFLNEFHRTIGTEYLNKLQFTASEQSHVALRAKAKEIKAQKEKEDARQYQDWLNYEVKQKNIKQDRDDALSHISC